MIRPTAAPGEHGAFRPWHLLAIAAVTVLAAGLRLFRLGEWALWVDEAHTFRDAFSPWNEFWDAPVANYPLSYLLMRGLVALGWETSEGWLRLPYAFFGVLSVPALALVGRRIVGPRAAIIAALLLACCPWHVYWSQNVRSYPMVVFFAILGAGAMHRGVVRHSWPSFIAALVAVLIAGACHPSAHLLLATFLGYAFLYGRRSEALRTTARWLPAAILVVMVVLLWLLEPLAQRVRGDKAGFSLFHLAHTLAFFLRLPLVVMAAGGLVWLLRRRESTELFLGAWVVVPALALAMVGATGFFKVTAQYLFFILPGVCLLAAVMIVEIGDRFALDGLRGLVLRAVPLGIVLLDMGGQCYLYFNKQHGERPLWRDAAVHVAAAASPRKRVLTTNQPSLAYYLAPEGFLRVPPRSPVEVVGIVDYLIDRAGGPEAFVREHVAEAHADGEELFVVVTEPELMEIDRTGLINRYVREHCHQVLRLPNFLGPKDMTVLVYRVQ